MTAIRYQTVLFDLDGTLVDSRPGIVASVRQMLTELGHQVDPDANLDWLIGPPIEQAFGRLLARYGDDRVELAVATYRAHYESGGLFDAQPFEGIPALLDELAAEGRTLLVATSKLRPYALRVLDHLDLARRFEDVHATEPDGRFRHKTDLLRHVVEQRALGPECSVMVGDREHDVEAALAVGLAVIAVTYGYGDVSELLAAGARTLCDSPASLRGLL